MSLLDYYNESRRELNLVSRNIDTNGCTEIENILRSNRTLQKLSLKYCNIDEKGIEAICNGLSENASLTDLHLDYNRNIGTNGCKAIGQMLRSNQALQKLSLKECNINDEGIEEIFCGLYKNKFLKKIDLKGNKNQFNGPIGETGRCWVIRHLSTRYPSLIFLSLCEHQHSVEKQDEDMDVIMSMVQQLAQLEVNTSWEKLRIDYKEVQTELHCGFIMKAPITTDEILMETTELIRNLVQNRNYTSESERKHKNNIFLKTCSYIESKRRQQQPPPPP